MDTRERDDDLHILRITYSPYQWSQRKRWILERNHCLVFEFDQLGGFCIMSGLSGAELDFVLADDDIVVAEKVIAEESDIEVGAGDRH
ncbi:MAG: hypothetical protein OHK0037_23220 [Elainellaceae cyanobacterium]